MPAGRTPFICPASQVNYNSVAGSPPAYAAPYVFGASGSPPGGAYTLWCACADWGGFGCGAPPQSAGGWSDTTVAGKVDHGYPGAAVLSPTASHWSIRCHSGFLDTTGPYFARWTWDIPGLTFAGVLFCALDIHGAYSQLPFSCAGIDTNSPACSCWCCPTGFKWDPESRWCLDTPCPAGQCWCAASNACVPCPVDCKEELHCSWDPSACDWVCDTPTCPPGYAWHGEPDCACLPIECDPGECYCTATDECVPCPDPPCKAERSCEWNQATCSWDCFTPSCPPDTVFSLATCECEPDCPPGECWCAPSEACVSCPDPDCKEQLGCIWDSTVCDWVCEDPEEFCPPDSTWNPDTCLCEGAEAPYNLETQHHGFAVTDTQAGLRFRWAPRTVPPFTRDVQVTTDPADGESSVVMDWRRRFVVLTINEGRVQERVSTDQGETWSAPLTLAGTIAMPVKHPRIAGPQPWNGAVVRAWYDGGTLKGKIQYPGDTSLSGTFTFKDSGGLDLAVDDSGFGLSPAPDAPRRWLLTVIQSGVLQNFQSFDGCRTWELIP